ncbi:alpha-sarcoglycan isoform X2 [Palaemon carinicauda]|uniref:alpha-sarcoglycan isoform X2 n=1 Tax=Palaemon carinicauda TaxID=392227 RepID=UPI0035B5867F
MALWPHGILLMLGASWCFLGVPASGSVLEIMSSEVFILRLTHHDFDFHSPGVTYRPSLYNRPDLPSWLHYYYSKHSKTGFVYGVPPEDISKFMLEVVARDKHTYQTSHRLYSMDVINQTQKPYEVRFKITNMNVDELLVDVRWKRLREVMAKLWNLTSSQLVVTSLTSATDRGDRKPLHPDEKEGVYVSYGSSKNFSQSLFELEKEVEPLWDHRPCPNYFKKTSYERFFQNASFAIDWCSFRMVDNIKKYEHLQDYGKDDNGHKSPVISALENEGRIYLQSRAQVVKRSYTYDVVHTILIPLVVMLVLLGLLTLAMCCHRTNIIPKGQDIQMVQYASINKASEALRMLNRQHEHSPHPSTATTTTQADTLPRSRTASPSSTLPRNSTLGSRRFEDYATLSRPDPPPYQRNGTTPTRQ